MKIGVLCEGEDTDAPVMKLFFEHLFPDHTFLIKGVSKAAIFSLGDLELKWLFDQGCERAMIVWDLLPTGYRMAVPSQWSEPASRREQRQKKMFFASSPTPTASVPATSTPT